MTGREPVPAPPGLDVTVPNAARIYDYFLDGKDNFAADRAAADELLRLLPDSRATCWEQRGFVMRAVSWMAGEAGIRQFLDIGSGLPTRSNVHQVVHGHAPEAHVVYADYDPAVVAHARALLATSPVVAAAQADLRSPESLLGHPDVRRLIDFSEPAAVLLCGVLHFVEDEERPREVVGMLREALAPGSCLVISHVTDDEVPEEISQAARRVWAGASARVVPRDRDGVLAFFDGLELVKPGLVDIRDWRARRAPGEPPPIRIYGGVGRRPAR